MKTGSIIASDLLSVVSKLSPVLSTVLGSPISGIAISMIAKKFGVAPDGITTAIATDPDAALKLKEIELDYGSELAKAASVDYATEVDDRKDARNHSVQYTNFLRHMAYLVTAGFFVTIIIIFSPIAIVDVTSNDRDILSMLVGMLVSKWQTIIDFFYGSSNHSSSIKSSTNQNQQ